MPKQPEACCLPLLRYWTTIELRWGLIVHGAGLQLCSNDYLLCHQFVVGCCNAVDGQIYKIARLEVFDGLEQVRFRIDDIIIHLDDDISDFNQTGLGTARAL